MTHTDTGRYITRLYYEGEVFTFVLGDHHSRALDFLELLEAGQVEEVDIPLPLYFDIEGFES